MPRAAAPERTSGPAAGGEVDDGERRDRIAGAAARCFARWGYSRTRMEDIAREAGIARPALYRYYTGKEALLLEVLVRHIEQRAAELHRRVRRRGPSGPLIVEALRTGITGADLAMAQTVLEEDVVHVTAKLVAESDAVFEAMSAYWQPYLEYARERGELRPGVELDQAVRWLTFIIFHFLTMPETVPPIDELARYLKTFVVNALVDS